jgi:glycosyltransferase involved in cell wall biosynthesis
MRISIVTPSFNQARYIQRTIDSVLEQQGDFQLDYRVIDGGSTDGTLDILASYGDRLHWISEPDHGQVDAINKGLSTATGDIIGWLNSDDLLLPGALAHVAQAFSAHPDAEWVHGRCAIIDEHDRTVRRWVSAYKHFRSRHHSFENLLTENYVSQMTAFWRRSAHEAVGYLDPNVRLAFDYDFFLRLAKRSAPVFIDEPIACFRWYAESKSGAGFVAQMTETNELARRYRSNPWTRVRARVKKLGIINVYRALALARAVVRRGASARSPRPPASTTAGDPPDSAASRSRTRSSSPATASRE